MLWLEESIALKNARKRKTQVLHNHPLQPSVALNVEKLGIGWGTALGKNQNVQVNVKEQGNYGLLGKIEAMERNF